MSRISLDLLFPGHGEQPVQIIAADGGFRGHRRHHFEALQFLRGLFVGVLGHAGGFDFLFQFLEFVLFAAAEFLVDGLQFFVEVILFLGALHLALHAGVDVAVDVELFDFAFQDFADARQAVQRIEIFQQFLLFLDRESAGWTAMVSESFAGSSTRVAAIMVS